MNNIESKGIVFGCKAINKMPSKDKRFDYIIPGIPRDSSYYYVNKDNNKVTLAKGYDTLMACRWTLYGDEYDEDDMNFPHFLEFNDDDDHYSMDVPNKWNPTHQGTDYSSRESIKLILDFEMRLGICDGMYFVWSSSIPFFIKNRVGSTIMTDNGNIYDFTSVGYSSRYISEKITGDSSAAEDIQEKIIELDLQNKISFFEELFDAMEWLENDIKNSQEGFMEIDLRSKCEKKHKYIKHSKEYPYYYYITTKKDKIY